MNIIIDQTLRAELNAGSKARLDATAIAESVGFSSISLRNNYRDDPASMAIDLFGVSHQLRQHVKLLAGGDYAVIQFPFRGHNVNLLKRFCVGVRKRGARSIALVHDLPSIVANRGNLPHEPADKFRCDYLSLSYFDAIIVHNNRMAKYLVAAGIPNSKLVVLDLFDYLLDEDPSQYRRVSPNVVSFAGNLDRGRAGFIYELLKSYRLGDIRLELFGQNYSGAQSAENFVDYKGACPPEELTKRLTGEYGLVWSGPSALNCEWPEGGYLIFNNPHKLSLYYASNMIPVVWKQSAVAEFVEKTHSGIIVGSLSELGRALAGQTETEHSTRKRNAEAIGAKVREGLYLKKALREAMEVAAG